MDPHQSNRQVWWSPVARAQPPGCNAPRRDGHEARPREWLYATRHRRSVDLDNFANSSAAALRIGYVPGAFTFVGSGSVADHDNSSIRVEESTAHHRASAL